tara:strand:- start:872 stop:1426 length:555 start_codon:yes stop_codon:yes gene_type:complete
MNYSLRSTLLLTILLFIGLFFFLRASSKDRTTTIEISTEKDQIDTLNILCSWLKTRGWNQVGGNIDQQTLTFKGQVISSNSLAIFLSVLGGLGSCSLGLVIKQIFPNLDWWPILLGIIGGPISGMIYSKKSQREEIFEFRLLDTLDNSTTLRLRAHRDELISLEKELQGKLKLESDGSLFKTPI